jgi:DNA-binding transcriptional MerR regulator
MEAIKKLSIQQVADIITKLKEKGLTIEEIEKIIFY